VLLNADGATIVFITHDEDVARAALPRIYGAVLDATTGQQLIDLAVAKVRSTHPVARPITTAITNHS